MGQVFGGCASFWLGCASFWLECASFWLGAMGWSSPGIALFCRPGDSRFVSHLGSGPARQLAVWWAGGAHRRANAKVRGAITATNLVWVEPATPPLVKHHAPASLQAIHRKQRARDAGMRARAGKRAPAAGAS